MPHLGQIAGFALSILTALLVVLMNDAVAMALSDFEWVTELI